MSTAVVEEKKSGTGLNQLEQLKKFTKVVADTGDFESMREFKPQDATTNPSLILQATQKEQYGHLLDEVVADRKNSGLTGSAQIEDIIDHLLVRFGCDILEIVPGPRFDRDRCAALVRCGRLDQEGTSINCAL